LSTPINSLGNVLLFLVILMMAEVLDCDAQIDDFRDIFSSCIPNKVIIKKAEGIESERTFLGYIKDGNRTVVYYVVKEFYTVQAAIVRHGHSRIFFFTKDKKIAAVYYLDDSKELPFKLSQNELYFKCNRNGKEMNQVVKIQKKLPVSFCLIP
jgi:hypothetical protein